MITDDDVVLALSNSGETDEILTIVPAAQAPGHAAHRDDRQARLHAWRAVADVHLDVSVPEEACPLGLAPTSSTTAALVMGDALAVALLEARGFTADDFARSHPAGSLGRRLLLQISDVMHAGDEVPRVGADATRQRGAGRDEPQAPGHDRAWSTTTAACSGCSPTATCAAPWTTSAATCARRRSRR